MAKPTTVSLFTLLLVAVGAGGWFAHDKMASCVVGMNGADASVTISGYGARETCAEYSRRQAGWYVRETSPAEGVLCEVQRGRLRYVVRDRGALMVIGRAICIDLQNQRSAGATER